MLDLLYLNRESKPSNDHCSYLGYTVKKEKEKCAFYYRDLLRRSNDLISIVIYIIKA